MVNLELLFGGQSGLDIKSVRFLLKAIERNNLPNFDYLEFKASLKEMQNLNLDESTAIKSTFATAKTVGLTKEHLLNTAKHYKNVLKKEESQFAKALETQVDRRIKGKRRETEKLKLAIEDYKKKIAELQQKIEAAQHKIDTADEVIESETAKIGETRKNFDFALSSIVNEIELDIQKFESNL